MRESAPRGLKALSALLDLDGDEVRGVADHTPGVRLFGVHQHPAPQGEGHHGVLEVTLLIVHLGVSFRRTMKRDTSYQWGFHPQSFRVRDNYKTIS